MEKWGPNTLGQARTCLGRVENVVRTEPMYCMYIGKAYDTVEMADPCIECMHDANPRNVSCHGTNKQVISEEAIPFPLVDI